MQSGDQRVVLVTQQRDAALPEEQIEHPRSEAWEQFPGDPREQEGDSPGEQRRHVRGTEIEYVVFAGGNNHRVPF
jgi:hypothetical protein